MNQLEKKARKDLRLYLFIFVAGGWNFYYLITHFDRISVLATSRARIIMLSAVVVIGIWVAVGQFFMKKRTLRGLDERQRLIYERAKMVSDSIFGGLCLAGYMGIFGWLGPKTPIPVFVPVLMFFVFAFIAEVIKPLVILIQCKMEQADE